jgi:hypothetical protein
MFASASAVLELETLRRAQISASTTELMLGCAMNLSTVAIMLNPFFCAHVIAARVEMANVISKTHMLGSWISAAEADCPEIV